MPDYRAYILGIDGHRFVWVEDFRSDHANDAVALEAAKALSDQHEVEVWDGGRLVACLTPAESAASPGLVPASAPDGEKKSSGPAEPISLSKVSEMASANSAATPESNPFVPGVEAADEQG
jgi:hypothetical protein